MSGNNRFLLTFQYVFYFQIDRLILNVSNGGRTLKLLNLSVCIVFKLIFFLYVHLRSWSTFKKRKLQKRFFFLVRILLLDESKGKICFFNEIRAFLNGFQVFNVFKSQG